ncbi:MAG: restriction endonuclease subunit S [Proteobacteria bacterium]|nr:restriction endonuclease subunit S [Pseudomonadota bacterium]
MERFDLPEGWVWQTLGELGRVIGGGTPAKSRRDFWEGDIPWVSPKDMKRPVINDTELKITNAALNESSAKLIPAPAVLFVVRGGILARHFPVATTQRPVTINQDMKAIIPHPAVLPEFLAAMIRGAENELLRMVDFSGHGVHKFETEKWRSFPIPVPPLHEQRRLVARIEAQTSRAEAIRKSQQELVDEMRGVLAGYYAEITADAKWKPMSEVAPQVRRPVTVQAGQSYPELGIRSFGKGTFHKPAISAEQLGTKRLYHIHPGDLIFNNVFAWECAVAVVKPEDAGRVGSHRFIT